MFNEETGYIETSGARLYYSLLGARRSSGPVLLILPGGDGDADSPKDIADRLIHSFAVLTYDRRGLSRSAIVGDVTGLTVGTHTDDVHQLLSVLVSAPVLVLGISLGALIALDLVARYPQQVHMVVAHEPPATQLLSDADQTQAVHAQEDVESAFRHAGIPAAMQKFASIAGLDFQDREHEIEIPRPSPARVANLRFFLTHDAPAARGFRVNLGALHTQSGKISVAAGQTSSAFFPYKCAAALAQYLHRPLLIFPGGHNGFITHPRAFAQKLHEVLATV